MLDKLVQEIENGSVTENTEEVVSDNVNITLRFSISNEVTVPPEVYESMTIAELFETYEDELGVDLGRASSYKDVTSGATVNGDSSVVPGHSYKVLIMTGGKG